MTNRPIYSLHQRQTHFFICVYEFKDYYAFTAKKIAHRSIQNSPGLIKEWSWRNIYEKFDKKFNKPVIIFTREPKERFIASIAEIYNPFEGYSEACAAKYIFQNTTGKNAQQNLPEYYRFCLENFFSSSLRDIHLSHYNSNILRLFIDHTFEKGFSVIDINSTEFDKYVKSNIKTDSTGSLKKIVGDLYEKIKIDNYLISRLYRTGFVDPERESYKILLNYKNE